MQSAPICRFQREGSRQLHSIFPNREAILQHNSYSKSPSGILGQSNYRNLVSRGENDTYHESFLPPINSKDGLRISPELKLLNVKVE